MNKIYVGNLSFDTTDADFMQLFAQFGEVTDSVLIRDRDTKRLKGFGFVTFKNNEDAEKALSMNGQDFMGRPLRVNFAQERRSGDRRRSF
ncbi:MAG: RNA-binding protein [Gammaproteobacteria bacterium]|nr:RNA-binding protein [Gammaproteobacteria bacterium]